jgi:hypothetical protein
MLGASERNVQPFPSSKSQEGRDAHHSLCDYAQPLRVFWRWRRGSTAFNLNEDYLQGVPTPNPTDRVRHDLCGLRQLMARIVVNRFLRISFSAGRTRTGL